MKCTECTTAYIFSSHATISGGDYESVDAYCRLAPDESAKINAFFAWLESAGERKEKLFSGIKRFLADFLENDQAFDLSALLDLKKNSCR